MANKILVSATIFASMQLLQPAAFANPIVRSPELEKSIAIYGSAQKFASAIGVHKNTPSNLRTGQRDISWPLAKRIAIISNDDAGSHAVCPLQLIKQLGN